MSAPTPLPSIAPAPASTRPLPLPYGDLLRAAVSLAEAAEPDLEAVEALLVELIRFHGAPLKGTLGALRYGLEGECSPADALAEVAEDLGILLAEHEDSRPRRMPVDGWATS